MPKVDVGVPIALKAFIYHGVDFRTTDGPQPGAECPFCGKLKFSVSAETGKWDCKVCQANGNPLSFLRQLHSASSSQPPLTSVPYRQLAEDRKLLSINTIVCWGICQSLITGEWLVPGYGADGQLDQLYKYVPCEGGRRCLPTPGVWEEGKAHALHRPMDFDPARPELWICEGPWDGMALDEVLRLARAGEVDGELELTGNEGASLSGRISVVAVPGAGVFRQEWCRLATGKRVVLLYDNDHPREVNGRMVDGAGILGMRRVAAMLFAAREPPSEICWLAWGERGFDQDLKSGYDVRDWLTED
jgi:hypothetical protein